MAGRQGASGNFRNSFVSLRAATTRRTFLCLSVLRQTSFVLMQFLLPWNLLSQLPRSVMLRLAPKPASQKSDETLMIPAPLMRLYPATQREAAEPFPAATLAQQHRAGSRNGGITPAGVGSLGTDIE